MKRIIIVAPLGDVAQTRLEEYFETVRKINELESELSALEDILNAEGVQFEGDAPIKLPGVPVNPFPYGGVGLTGVPYRTGDVIPPTVTFVSNDDKSTKLTRRKAWIEDAYRAGLYWANNSENRGE